jgi:preprotein translocase subunit SecB
MGIDLKGFKVNDIDFKNHFDGGTRQIQLQHKVSYNVAYNNTNNCKGTIEVTVSDRDNPDDFTITVSLTGLFTVTENLDKKQVHLETYKELLTIARSVVIAVTGNSGIPPIIVPDIKIDPNQVMRVDIRPQ